MKLSHLIIVSLFFFACQSEEAKQQLTTQTEARCTCYQELFELNEQVKALTQAGKSEQLINMISTIEKAANDAESCSNQQLKQEDALENSAILSHMESVCPKIHQMLERARAMEGN